MQYTITGGTDFADVLNQDGHRLGHSEQTRHGWTASWTTPAGRRKFRRNPVTGGLLYSTREQAIAWITAQEDNYRG